MPSKSATAAQTVPTTEPSARAPVSPHIHNAIEAHGQKGLCVSQVRRRCRGLKISYTASTRRSVVASVDDEFHDSDIDASLSVSGSGRAACTRGALAWWPGSLSLRDKCYRVGDTRRPRDGS